MKARDTERFVLLAKLVRQGLEPKSIYTAVNIVEVTSILYGYAPAVLIPQSLSIR